MSETKQLPAETLETGVDVNAARVALMACSRVLSREFPNCLTVLRRYIDDAESRAAKLESELSAVEVDRDEARTLVDRLTEELSAEREAIDEALGLAEACPSGYYLHDGQDAGSHWGEALQCVIRVLRKSKEKAPPPSPPPAEVCECWTGRDGQHGHNDACPVHAENCELCAGRPPPEETAGTLPECPECFGWGFVSGCLGSDPCPIGDDTRYDHTARARRKTAGKDGRDG